MSTTGHLPPWGPSRLDPMDVSRVPERGGTQRLPGPSQPGGGCRDCVWTWDIRQGGRWVRQCDECGKGNG